VLLVDIFIQRFQVLASLVDSVQNSADCLSDCNVLAHREISGLNDVEKSFLQVVVVGDKFSHIGTIVDDAIIIVREIIEDLEEFHLDPS
jgi:hypothetical protein